MNKNTKILYVFMLNEDDIGPKEHVRNVLLHSDCSIDVITNLDNSIWSNVLQKAFVSKFRNTFLNSLVFQIRVLLFILFNNKYEVILLRQSVGFFIIPFFKFIYSQKIYIEVNGVQSQDLLDRGRPLGSIINSVLEFITYIFCDKIICVHENIKNVLLNNFSKINSKNIYVVENGINPIAYLSSIDAKKQLRISLDEFRIGYLGSLAYREGVDFLIDIAKNFHNERIKFVIVGGSEHEILILNNRIKEHNLEKLFDLTPSLPLKDALFLMQTCDICIHLRRPIKGVTNSQGSPLKMLDYHNIGRFVIATDIDSYKYIKEENIGLLVSLDCMKNVHYKILQLKNDKSVASKGKRGRMFVQDKSWKNQMTKLDNILK
jgi:glycosyltransferase involved in cell wall biosynthesis